MTLNSMTRRFRRGTHSQQSWMPNRHYKCHMSKSQLEFLSHLIFRHTFPSQSMTTRIFHLLWPPTLFIIIPDSPVSLIGLHSQNSSKSCQPPESRSDYSHPLGGCPPSPSEALLSITTLFRSLLTSFPASSHHLSLQTTLHSSPSHSFI